MMDRTTFIPFSRTMKMEKGEVHITEENYRKRKTGEDVREKEKSVKLLDEMVTERGVESLLAIIHADGNNMGSKIADMLKGLKDYDSCVNKMRAFTEETKNAFVKAFNDDMNAAKTVIKEKEMASK